MVEIDIPGTQIDILKNPFSKNMVKSIHIWYFPGSKWSGTIEFQNGNTEGKQNFSDKEEISHLLSEMKIFSDSLGN